MARVGFVIDSIVFTSAYSNHDDNYLINDFINQVISNTAKFNLVAVRSIRTPPDFFGIGTALTGGGK